MSKPLRVQELWQLKVFLTKNVLIMIPRREKLVLECQFRFTFHHSPSTQIFGCACLKHKWLWLLKILIQQPFVLCDTLGQYFTASHIFIQTVNGQNLYSAPSGQHENEPAVLHCTLHTNCTLHFTHCILQIVHYTLHTAYRKLYNTLFILHYTLDTNLYMLHTVHFTLSYKLHTIHFTHYTLHISHRMFITVPY